MATKPEEFSLEETAKRRDEVIRRMTNTRRNRRSLLRVVKERQGELLRTARFVRAARA